eukprot:4877958-Pyramimonas_sp.AAC.1
MPPAETTAPAKKARSEARKTTLPGWPEHSGTGHGAGTVRFAGPHRWSCPSSSLIRSLSDEQTSPRSTWQVQCCPYQAAPR